MLAVFAMGGGGGADDTVSGSSGFFDYAEVEITTGRVYTVNVNIGNGGDRSGLDTTVTVLGMDGDFTVTGKGGGYAGRSGWSGGSSEKGGWNGSSGASKSNGNGQSLPKMCGSMSGPVVKLEPGKTGDYDNDGTGGGGVIVDGQSPYHRYYRDGYGYGAGGGEDYYDGYDGVAVLALCYP